MAQKLVPRGAWGWCCWCGWQRLGKVGCRWPFASSHGHERRVLHVRRMRVEWIKEQQLGMHQAAPASNASSCASCASSSSTCPGGARQLGVCCLLFASTHACRRRAAYELAARSWRQAAGVCWRPPTMLASGFDCRAAMSMSLDAVSPCCPGQGKQNVRCCRAPACSLTRTTSPCPCIARELTHLATGCRGSTRWALARAVGMYA